MRVGGAVAWWFWCGGRDELELGPKRHPNDKGAASPSFSGTNRDSAATAWGSRGERKNGGEAALAVCWRSPQLRTKFRVARSRRPTRPTRWARRGGASARRRARSHHRRRGTRTLPSSTPGRGSRFEECRFFCWREVVALYGWAGRACSIERRRVSHGSTSTQPARVQAYEGTALRLWSAAPSVSFAVYGVVVRLVLSPCPSGETQRES